MINRRYDFSGLPSPQTAERFDDALRKFLAQFKTENRLEGDIAVQLDAEWRTASLRGITLDEAKQGALAGTNTVVKSIRDRPRDESAAD